jgi:hypothetical protein
MPRLLNDAVQLKGTTGTNSFFITLDAAQPLLDVTPSTTTGYTLVTRGVQKQLVWTNTLGQISFNAGIIYSDVPNGDLTLTSTGTGRLNLLGNVFASFQELTATNLVVSGSAEFTSATNTATFYGNVELIGNSVTISPITSGSINNTVIGNVQPSDAFFDSLYADNIFASYVTATNAYINTLTTVEFSADIAEVNTLTSNLGLFAFGPVSLQPNNGDVSISPGGTGKVYITSGGVGYMDRLIIGSTSPQAGYFTDLTVDTLTLNQSLNISTGSYINLTADYLTVNYDLTTTNLVVTGDSSLTTVTVTTLNGGILNDNGNRVVTDIEVQGTGISASTTKNNSTVTIILTNTGVLSLAAGTGTAISTQTGDITIWSTATLQNVTDQGSTTDNIVHITNVTSSTTSTDGALIVDGGVGVGGDVNVGGDVYSRGGSPVYNYLLYTPKVTVNTTPPLDPRIGDFWIDPSVGVEYQLVPNGTATIWVQFIGF